MSPKRCCQLSSGLPSQWARADRRQGVWPWHQGPWSVPSRVQSSSHGRLDFRTTGHSLARFLSILNLVFSLMQKSTTQWSKLNSDCGPGSELLWSFKSLKELRPNLTLWFTVLKIWTQIVSYYAQRLRVHSIVQIFSAELLSTNNKYKNKQLPAFLFLKRGKRKENILTSLKNNVLWGHLKYFWVLPFYVNFWGGVGGGASLPSQLAGIFNDQWYQPALSWISVPLTAGWVPFYSHFINEATI